MSEVCFGGVIKICTSAGDGTVTQTTNRKQNGGTQPVEGNNGGSPSVMVELNKNSRVNGNNGTQPTGGTNNTQPTSGGNNTQPANGGNNTRPANGTNNTQPVGGNNGNQPTGGGNSTQPVGGNQGTKPAVIINLSDQAKLYYINGNAVIYNINGNVYSVYNNNQQGGSVIFAVPQGGNNAAENNESITYNAPYAGIVNGKPTGEHRVSLRAFVEENLASLGAIKVNNPVRYALERAKAHKRFVDAFINEIGHRLRHLEVHERVDKSANLYQYSVVARGKGLKLNEWVQLQNDQLQYGLKIKTPKLKFDEWIAVNTQTQMVDYGVKIKTPGLKVKEWFSGTPAGYTYDLVVNRRPHAHRLEGVTIGSAHREGNRIILTPNERSQRGAFWSNEKVDLTKNFTVKANLYLGNRPQGADGIAFVIQNSPQGKNAIGALGGGLGYGSIKNSFAIEFDTWKNPRDINGNHLGFDINGSLNSKVAIPLPQPLESGKEIPVTIKWNYLGNNRAQVNVEIFGQTYSYTLNNIEQLFGGKEAYIGFTGATGGERNLQYVANPRIEIAS